MKTILFILFLILISSNVVCAIDAKQEVIPIAKKYLYVREATNNNDAPEITYWLKKCGLGPGYAYCQSYVNNMFFEVYETYNLGKCPIPKHSSVARFAEYCIKRPLQFDIMSTKSMQWSIDRPKMGDIISWKHGSSAFSGFDYRGHAGLVISTDEKGNIYTIEGNTKPSAKGDQTGSIKGQDPKLYGHDGVYLRTRRIGLSSNFPIMYFIRLKQK